MRSGGDKAEASIYVYSEHTHLVENNILFPVDEYLQTYHQPKSQWFKAITDALTINGKMYGLPKTGHPGDCFIWINLDMFKQAGIKEPPTYGATWDDVRTWANKLAKGPKDNRDVYGLYSGISGIMPVTDALIVPAFFGGGAFSIFLLRQFILTLPFELDEAAMIDGAGRLRILLSVILPNSKPALVTVALFSFIAHWNDFFGPLIFLNTRKNFTIPLGLYALKTYTYDPGKPTDQLLMAGSVIATLPIIVIFLSFQRYFIQGIVTSGLKG